MDALIADLRSSPRAFDERLLRSNGAADLGQLSLDRPLVDTGCGPKQLGKTSVNGVILRACFEADADPASATFLCGACRAIKVPKVFTAEAVRNLVREREMTTLIRQRLELCGQDSNPARAAASAAARSAATHVVHADLVNPDARFMSMEVIVPTVPGVYTFSDLVEWMDGRPSAQVPRSSQKKGQRQMQVQRKTAHSK